MAIDNCNSLSIHENISNDGKPTKYFMRFILDMCSAISNRIRWQGDFVANKTYIKNDMVKESSSLYIANKKTNEAPPHVDWDSL